MRFLLLKISATIATLILGGCNLPPISVTPTPQPAAPVEHKLTITVDGGAGINVGGAAKIDVANASPRQPEPPTLCPCCGSTVSCLGLCGKVGCTCSRGTSAAATTVGESVALPQFEIRRQRRTVCENGICRVIEEDVRVPTATAAKRTAAHSTQGGRITIYDNGSPAGRAMRAEIGSKGVEWKSGDPPVAINGVRWSPTAVKPDGSAWTPGAGGWHGLSAGQFQAWVNQ
jgi:hypothetical protein